MASYVTQEQLNLECDKKVDKTSVVTVLSDTPTEDRIPSEKLLATELEKVKYPDNLCECLNSFDHMYLGYRSSHPKMDIDGKGLSVGLMYWNTVDKVLYVYDGKVWQKSLSTVPFSVQERTHFKSFDVNVDGTTSTVAIPEGYNPDTVQVYLNGVKMSLDDFIAIDGQTITFTEPLEYDDVVSGFSTWDGDLRNFDVENLTSGATEIAIPEGYQLHGLAVYVNGIRMSLDDYEAPDGKIIRFKLPLNVNDVVSGYYLVLDDRTTPIVTEVDKIENAPNPAVNGAIAWDRSRNMFFYYSATDGAWIGKREEGTIEFYDKKEDFPDKTTATLDKIYIDRSTKTPYMFDGSEYIPHGILYNQLPTKGTDGVLYLDDKGVLRYWDGTSYQVLADAQEEEIQIANDSDDFAPLNGRKLFVNTSNDHAYYWNGTEFVDIKSAGAGSVEFIENENDANQENTLFVDKDHYGKLYYYEDGKQKRANKELWRMANDLDLQTNAPRDEDFIYLVDDTNVLKKWDNGTNRFETLGTPKVVHHFAPEDEINKADKIPTRSEVESYSASKAYTDCIVWGNFTNDEGISTQWAYSIDSDGKAVLIYANELKQAHAFAVSDGEQETKGQLRATITKGNITIKNGDGATLNIKETDATDDISNGSGKLIVTLNGQVIPYKDITQSGNDVIINTDRVLPNGVLYDNAWIEFKK
jgi:hypothetical protein